MKKRNRILCLICCLVLSLSGCGTSNKTDTKNTTSDISAESSTEFSVTQKKLRQAGAGTAASKKEELVYASASADGTVYETTVETTLINKGTDYIIDSSKLNEIKNTEGAEEFIQLASGDYLWENLGEDIQYEGTGDTTLPVRVSFTFYLDGKSIAPENLAKQSGHVKIRIDYENLERRSITIDSTLVNTVVPFTAITALSLDEEKFSNITVTNGELVSMSGMQMAVGYAMPGVENALDIDGLDLDSLKELSDREEEENESIDIPAYVEIEADVTDFSLEFTETIVTPGLLSDFSTDTLKDLESAIDGMTELGNTSSEIKEGFSELSDGVTSFYTPFKTFNSSIRKLYGGASSAKTGMKKILEAGDDLEDGADGIADGLETLQTALTSSDGTEDIDLSGLENMQTILESIGNDVTDLVTVAAQIQADYIALEEYKQSVQNYHSSVKDNATAVLDTLDHMDTTNLTEEQISAITEMQTDLSTLLETTLPKLPESSVDTELLSSAATDLTEQIQTLVTAAEGLSTALSELSEFTSQLEELQNGITTLSEYASQLSSGVVSYNEALNTLYKEGIVAITDGIGSLADAGDILQSGLTSVRTAVNEFRKGYAEFDEEGIQKLADIGDSDAILLLQRIQALKQADSMYDNFAGKFEKQESSVTFLIETDSIE